MGRVTFKEAARVYIDANVCIYHLEGKAEYENHVRALLQAVADRGLILLTSELSLAEALVPAIKLADASRVGAYLDFFESGAFVTLLPTSRAVYLEVAKLRAQYPLKTPDAIHVASALVAECEAFITNDLRLRAPRPLVMLRIEDF